MLEADRQPNSKPHYLLVYGRGGNASLAALDQLRRTANEARGDKADFDRLRGIKDIPHADDLLARLSSDAAALLCRIKLVNLPEPALDDALKSHASILAGNKSSQLTELAFSLLCNAAATRTSVTASDLVAIALSRGINLDAPPNPDLPDDRREVTDALTVLQSAQEGLPVEVLARAVHQTPALLEERLEALLDRKLFSKSGGRWKLMPFPRKLVASTPDVLAASLEAVLLWIQSRKGQHISRADIMCGIKLAEATVTLRPEAVARIFIYLDKPLKRLGDKHLILSAANLAIDAARATARPRPIEVIEGEAQALICGRSWVYQRIDRIEEAKFAAVASLRLGQDVGWDRNTAFCEKCIGRLCRIEAEATEDIGRKTELFDESIAHLEKSISSFTAAGNMAEVGDCLSLLGRTYLVNGRVREADAAAERAETLVVDFDSKDYFDLLILIGDLAVVRRDFQQAEVIYQEAVQLQDRADSEKSEILARAHFQRAKCYLAQQKKSLALSDFREAAKIWHQLDERAMESKAAWEELRLSSQVPDDLLAALRAERVPVRVRSVKMYEERKRAAVARNTAKRMKSPSPAFWVELIREARHQEASGSSEW
jgi:tetratricopeptide (TPR) repeat protein